jgi:ribosomal protein S18 acetylase RimI-like enzyme
MGSEPLRRGGDVNRSDQVSFFPFKTHFQMSSNTDIQVRPAKLGDAKTIAEIHVEAWVAAYTGIVPDEHLKSFTVAKREVMWQDAIKFSEPQVWVAMDANAIVGFVGFDRSRDAKSKATMGEIWAMYVAPDYWDNGVGLALWDAARDGLVEEGCTDVSLWVLLKNERALRFYDLAGFKREMNTAKTVPMGGGKVEEIRMRRKLD